MKLQRVIEILEKHQNWRRDHSVPAKIEMQSPIEIGTAIDYALRELKKLNIDDVRLCFPTDEDIEDIAESSYPSLGGYNDTSYHERMGFKEGAEWVINMIKNSKKWK